MSLIQEILLEPRWDEKNLNLIKQSTLNQVATAKGDPNSIAKLNIES
jgi:zinc protease